MRLKDLIKTAPVEDPFSELSAEDKAEADMKAEIAIHIHDKRVSMNMTQKEFAEFTGVSQTMVSKWESGGYNFTIGNLSRLMATLGMKLEIVTSPERRADPLQTGSCEKDRFRRVPRHPGRPADACDRGKSCGLR